MANLDGSTSSVVVLIPTIASVSGLIAIVRLFVIVTPILLPLPSIPIIVFFSWT